MQHLDLARNVEIMAGCSRITEPGLIKLDVLVAEWCVTFFADVGLTIGELKERIEESEKIPAAQQSIVHERGNGKILPNNQGLFRDATLEVIVDADDKCVCCKRKLLPFEESYQVSCDKASKIIKKQTLLDKHMKAAHPEVAWVPRPNVPFEPCIEKSRLTACRELEYDKPETPLPLTMTESWRALTNRLMTAQEFHDSSTLWLLLALSVRDGDHPMLTN